MAHSDEEDIFHDPPLTVPVPETKDQYEPFDDKGRPLVTDDDEQLVNNDYDQTSEGLNQYEPFHDKDSPLVTDDELPANNDYDPTSEGTEQPANDVGSESDLTMSRMDWERDYYERKLQEKKEAIKWWKVEYNVLLEDTKILKAQLEEQKDLKSQNAALTNTITELTSALVATHEQLLPSRDVSALETKLQEQSKRIKSLENDVKYYKKAMEEEINLKTQDLQFMNDYQKQVIRQLEDQYQKVVEDKRRLQMEARSAAKSKKDYAPQ